MKDLTDKRIISICNCEVCEGDAFCSSCLFKANELLEEKGSSPWPLDNEMSAQPGKSQQPGTIPNRDNKEIQKLLKWLRDKFGLKLEAKMETKK